MVRSLRRVAFLVLTPLVFSGLVSASPATASRSYLHAFSSAAAARAEAVPSAELSYYGGRVLSHVKIDVVVWGSWSYGATVPLNGARSIASFAGGIANSRYLDWLREYDTPTQHIGRGTLDAVYTVHPPAASNRSIVSDAQIRTALATLAASAALPSPSSTRLYVIFFRKGQTVTLPDGDSGHDFCAYHDTMAYKSSPAYYAVVPYELDNPGCRIARISFDRVTTIVSHELVEAITDPGVGLRRIAWYDRSHGEIADICAKSSAPGSVVGGDGVRYVVQREWSNHAQACVLYR